MALILVAPLMAVTRLILSKGATQAAKKYGPKLIKEAKNFITKNNLKWDGKKIIEKTASKVKTVPKVNPKIKTKTSPKVNPKTKTTTKSKDTFDEALKKKEGSKVFDTKNQQAEYYAKNFKKTDSTKVPVKKNELVKYYDDSKLGKTPGTLPKNMAGKVWDSTRGKWVAASALSLAALPVANKGIDIAKGMFTGSGSTSGTNKKINKGSSNNNTSTSGKTSGNVSSFGEAFRKARKEKGTDSTFTWQGKTYSTVTMDEVKKAGFDNLTQYLNAKKKG
jgi:hypothetical protein